MSLNFIKKMENLLRNLANGRYKKAYDYKIVSLYADASNNLYMIPNSEKQMRGVVGGAITEMEIVNYIAYPYTDEDLENVVYKTFEECHGEVYKSNNILTPLEKYLNTKGCSRSMNDKRYINLYWSIDDGFNVTPTKKILNKGYTHLEEQKISLGKVVNRGELANAIKQALLISTL